jgi:hypothetical protein
MKEEKYSIKTDDNDPGVFYLELSDLSEASIQIWEEEGEVKRKPLLELNSQRKNWRKL